MRRRFQLMVLVSMLLLLLTSGLAEAKNGGVTPQSFNYLSKAQSLMFVNTNNTISVKGEPGHTPTLKKSRLLYIWKSTTAAVGLW